MNKNGDSGFCIGQVYCDEFIATAELVGKFAEFSEDFNPVHVDKAAAMDYGYAKPFAHGAILSAVLSRLIGMQVPGSGAVWMNQSMEWLLPIFIGDTVFLEVRIQKYSTGAGILDLEITAKNQKGDQVMSGSAKVKQGKKLSERKCEGAEPSRLALVTGGSRGIGASIALELGRLGYNVAIGYRSSEDAAFAVRDEINRENSGVAECFKVDLSDVAQIGDMISKVNERFGSPDIVVHSATPPIVRKTILDFRNGDFQEMLDIYLTAAHELVQRTAQQMVDRHFGRYIFLGTSAIFSPEAKMAAYITGKYALLGYARSLAFELGPKGITSNVVSPSMAVTDLTEEVPARLKEIAATRSAARRLVRPDEIASFVGFLSSPAGGYLNGVNQPMTGGPV